MFTRGLYVSRCIVVTDTVVSCATGGQLVVADYCSVLLLDVQLNVERILLHSDNDYNDDDYTERFSRPLRLTYSSSARRLFVACRSQFVSVYSWQPSITPVSPFVSET